MSRLTGVPFEISTTDYRISRPGVGVERRPPLQPYSSIRRYRSVTQTGATVAGGRLVVLQDSFFDNVEPLVLPFFNEVWLINWNKIDKDSLAHAIQSADYVVIEVAERSASRIFNDVVAPMVSSLSFAK